MSRLERRLVACLKDMLAGDSYRVPEGATILWTGFAALSRARTCGPAGPNPIAFSEISAWMYLMSVPLEASHVRILTALDRAWMDVMYERRNIPEGAKALPQRSKHGITADLFDIAVG